MTRRFSYWALALTLLVTAVPAVQAADQVADVFVDSTSISFRLFVPDNGTNLVITGPRCFEFNKRFGKGDTPGYAIDASTRDGLYRYRMQVRPPVDRNTQAILKRARQEGDSCIIWDLRDEGLLPAGPQVVDGYFRVNRGKIVLDANEGRAKATSEPADLDFLAGGPISQVTGNAASGGSGFQNINAADFVINDDLIVDGSACIGFDCVNGESFGFDTIRLKENNLRIKFDDTSVAASFPRNDWQLTANDSANGGASKFSIDDISGGRTPFTVEANARSHSLYVDDGGRIGNRTSTPSTEIHTIDGDTPTLRLQQDGSSGFAPQTWDVAGNETNFFVRDVTNGSTLPFRIRPGAPTSSIFIDVDGDVGMGTSSPGVPLHIVESTGSNTPLLKVTNNAPVSIQLENTAETDIWSIRRSGSGLAMDSTSGISNTLYFDDGRVRLGTGGAGAETFLLAANGDLTIAGTLTENSDRNSKHNIVPVTQDEILAKVMQLPIATWERIVDEPDVQHLGPMAQDFFALFGLGDDNRHIATIDTSGVALAAIQALGTKLAEKDALLQANQTQLDTLQQQNVDLLQRLEALEAKLAP